MKINVGGQSKKETKPSQEGFSAENSFDFGFGSSTSQPQKIESKPQNSNDWATFDFGLTTNAPKPAQNTSKPGSKNTNLLDFD